jgi:hypothetical protein
MYLPDELPAARVLITVKAYPLPSSKYEELVCTAGILPDGKWIRIYPIPFRALPYVERYQKYYWITINLKRNVSDFRPESYRPSNGVEEHIQIGECIDTSNGWEERKQYVLKEVFTAMRDLIKHAKSQERKSLGTLKPAEIIDFIVEPGERQWKKEWLDQLRQYNLFELDEQGQGKKRRVIRKVPYKYFYKFLSQGDTRPHKLMIEDWELGALYWNCLRNTGGDEDAANKLVRRKYFEEFIAQKDIYLFLGTTKAHHMRSENPFIIIGVFYPPKPEEKKLDVQQLTMF